MLGVQALGEDAKGEGTILCLMTGRCWLIVQCRRSRGTQAESPTWTPGALSLSRHIPTASLAQRQRQTCHHRQQLK